jgi:hypothetical protein
VRIRGSRHLCVHVVLQPPQCHLLGALHPTRCALQVRHAQDRERLAGVDLPAAEPGGHLGRPVLGVGQGYEPPRGARRQVEPLLGEAREALEAQLDEEPTLLDLPQDAAGLEVDILEERSGRAEPAAQLAGVAVLDPLHQRGQLGRHRRDQRCPAQARERLRAQPGLVRRLDALPRTPGSTRHRLLRANLRPPEHTRHLGRHLLGALPDRQRLAGHAPRQLQRRGPEPGDPLVAGDADLDLVVVFLLLFVRVRPGRIRRAEGLDQGLHGPHGPPPYRLQAGDVGLRGGDPDDEPRDRPAHLA